MTVTIVNGWIKEAIGIYYTAKSFGPFTQPVKFGVIHGTASPGASAQNIANDWANNPGDASAHVIINKDGTFVQGISLDYTAWANGNNTGGAVWLPPGNPNQYTFAMEHCKNDALYNSDLLTPEQQATSFELWDAICTYHHIPRQVVTVGDITNGGIIRHADIDPQNRTYCPGPYPFRDLQQFLNGGNPVLVDTTNQMIVELWANRAPFFKAMGQPLPRRDTGIFNSWRAELLAGRYRGPVMSDEYATVDTHGVAVVAQDYGGGTAHWYKKTGVTNWL